VHQGLRREIHVSGIPEDDLRDVPLQHEGQQACEIAGIGTWKIRGDGLGDRVQDVREPQHPVRGGDLIAKGDQQLLLTFGALEIGLLIDGSVWKSESTIADAGAGEYMQVVYRHSAWLEHVTDP